MRYDEHWNAGSPAGRGNGTTSSGEEQLQVVVHFGTRTHGASRVAGEHFLFNGYGWAYADDAVDVRLFKPAHELACVAAQALHISSLPFGIERIEGQAALSAAAQAGNHHQLAAWYVHANVLQVVYPCALHADEAVR